jgi:hypothetical protein
MRSAKNLQLCACDSAILTSLLLLLLLLLFNAYAY